MAGGLDFRRLQAVADLCAVAVDGAGALPDGAAALIHAHGCRFEATESNLMLLGPVEETAATPEAPGFAAAQALLLADCLQGGLDPRGLAFWWDVVEAERSTLPVQARTAILTGYAAVADDIPGMNGPGTDDLVSIDRQAVLDELHAIARRVPRPVLEDIAKADYGYQADRHLEALEDALASPTGWRADNPTYPSEVVELVSHVPEKPGFAAMTALLMADAVERGDFCGDMEFRWSNNSATYLAMPVSIGPAVLAGFRCLYETVQGWNPYLNAEFSLLEHKARTIPLAGDRFLRKDTA